ncbi:unannotated protein [freshwater metagenome]|uniref:Unannotated protein n=1 Tax=freshwater metagenome TaxID=449393 RepID=A0A6J7QQE9_9ZZZZ
MAKAFSITSFGTRIFLGVTPSNSVANLINSLSSPDLTRASIGSTNFKALATSMAARGNRAAYSLLLSTFPRRSTWRITFKLYSAASSRLKLCLARENLRLVI